MCVPLTGWSLGTNYDINDQEMLKTVGLSTTMFLSIFIATLSASAALSKEISDKTALTVMTKPLSRVSFVLGKYVGIAGAVTLAFFVITLVFLLTVRHGVIANARTPVDWPVVVLGITALLLTFVVGGLGNFVFNWSFNSSVVISMAVLFSITLLAVSFLGKNWELISFFDTFNSKVISVELLTAILLIFYAVQLVSAFAVAVSTRLSQVLTLVVTLIFFFVGAMYEFISPKLAANYFLGDKLFWAMPNLPFFFPLDALEKATSIPLGSITLYFLSYLAGVVFVAIALFQTRELAGKQTTSSAPGPVMLISGLGRIASIIAAVVFASTLLKPISYASLSTVGISILLLVIAVAFWLLFKTFGNGNKISYFLNWALAGALITTSLILIVPLFYPAIYGSKTFISIASSISGNAQSIINPTPIIFYSSLGVLLAIMLALPKTRAHFKSDKRAVLIEKIQLASKVEN